MKVVGGKKREELNNLFLPPPETHLPPSADCGLIYGKLQNYKKPEEL